MCSLFIYFISFYRLLFSSLLKLFLLSLSLPNCHHVCLTPLLLSGLLFLLNLTVLPSMSIPLQSSFTSICFCLSRASVFCVPPFLSSPTPYHFCVIHLLVFLILFTSFAITSYTLLVSLRVCSLLSHCLLIWLQKFLRMVKELRKSTTTKARVFVVCMCFEVVDDIPVLFQYFTLFTSIRNVYTFPEPGDKFLWFWCC
jgi:hypothetical protein